MKRRPRVDLANAGVCDEPDITPQEFWATALKTGRTVKVTLDKETADLGTIADPAALIQALKPGS